MKKLRLFFLFRNKFVSPFLIRLTQKTGCELIIALVLHYAERLTLEARIKAYGNTRRLYLCWRIRIHDYVSKRNFPVLTAEKLLRKVEFYSYRELIETTDEG